jgi:hypothetical protein
MVVTPAAGVRAHQVGLPRGFAYVEYSTAEEAEAARDHMDAAQIDGNIITCVPMLCICMHSHCARVCLCL